MKILKKGLRKFFFYSTFRYLGIFYKLKLTKESKIKTIMVTGGNGSVGSFTIQLIRNFCNENNLNIKIITTCSNKNFEKCRKFGA